MLEGNHFQNAYVTRDIDKALDTFRQRLNAPQEIRSFDVTVDVKTPAGSGAASNRVAFIWIDNLQYELIQPVSGLVSIYSDQLPADDSLKFHHICMRVDDWDSFRGKVDRQGYPVALEGGSDALKFVYLDARDTLGHYLEYVWMTPARWAQLGGR